MTELLPRSGSAWADLGLCWGKLDDAYVPRAIAANRKALALSPGNAKLRKAAIYNLAKLKGSALGSHVPGPTEDLLSGLEGVTPLCEIYDAPAGCAKVAWGCVSPDINGGLVRLGLNPLKIAAKKLPRVSSMIDDPGDSDPEPVIDGDVVVRSQTRVALGGKENGCDHQELQCQIVWADACAARAGIACSVSWVQGPPADDETEGCPDPEFEAVEISLR